MPYRRVAVALLCLPSACFNPDPPPGDTDAGGTTDDATSDPSTNSTLTGASSTTMGSDSQTSDPDTTDPGNELCGNGDLDGEEECDLGPDNSDNGGCTTACTLARCGDGLVQVGEEDCDDSGESATCNDDCTGAACGDGVLNATAGETCDTDTIANGSCDACQLACDAGFTDCGGGPGDGCETETNVDPENCGRCGSPCGGDEVCEGGECFSIKRVFLSSEVLTADFGGTDGADDRCNSMAAAAGLTGFFMAWVSSADLGVSVADRFVPHDGPYVLVDGTVIATDWTDLTDGSLAAPILLDEYGNPPAGFGGGLCHGGATCTTTFTGTTAAGASYVGEHDDCDGWSTTTFLPAFAGGDANATDEGWSLSAAGLRCDYAARIYCFEQ